MANLPPGRSMKTKREEAMHLKTRVLPLAASLLAMWFAVPVQAQENINAFPSKPFRLIVPYSAGSGTDLAARRAAQGIADRLGKPLVAENKTGATGLIGLTEMAKSPADGYTLAHVNIAVTLAQAMMQEMNFNLSRDAAGIGQYAAQYAVIVAPADQPVKTVADLVALAKSRPGALSFGSGGNGTPAHMTCEFFKRSVNIRAEHVPYKSIVTALNDTARGDLQFSCSVVGNAVALMQSGRLRALAVSNPTRSKALPDVPTLTELGVKGVDVRSWAGLVVPAKTPSAIVAKLNKALVDTVADPQVRAMFEKLGLDGVDGENTPAAFDSLIRSEGTRWATVVKELNLKPD
jgi:tripartite-type tricarboxylate transporter receptor subunit TctC